MRFKTEAIDDTSLIEEFLAAPQIWLTGTVCLDDVVIGRKAELRSTRDVDGVSRIDAENVIGHTHIRNAPGQPDRVTHGLNDRVVHDGDD